MEGTSWVFYAILATQVILIGQLAFVQIGLMVISDHTEMISEAADA